MASNLPTLFFTEFDTRVRNEYQFTGKLMYNMFYTRMGAAEKFRFNKQGIAYSHKHLSNSPLVLGTIDHSVMEVPVTFYDVPLTIDPVEMKQLNFSIEQEYIKEAKNALGRRKDAVLLDAITSTATLNVVPKDISGANAGLTLEALQETAALMDTLSVPDINRVILLHPKQLHNLLKSTKVTSSDYNSVKALVNGQLDTFYGFKFIKIPPFSAEKGIITGLPDDGNDTACYAFVASGDSSCPIAVGVNTDITFKTAEIPHMGFSTLIYGLIGLGAKIIDEKGIVKINCVSL